MNVKPVLTRLTEQQQGAEKGADNQRPTFRLATVYKLILDARHNNIGKIGCENKDSIPNPNQQKPTQGSRSGDDGG